MDFKKFGPVLKNNENPHQRYMYTVQLIYAHIPEQTTVAVMLRSFKGVQAASKVLQAGNMTPSPQPTIIRSIINNVDPPSKNENSSYVLPFVKLRA